MTSEMVPSWFQFHHTWNNQYKKTGATYTKGESEMHGEDKAHLSFAQFTVGSSILFTTTSSLETPKVFASWTCSRVCPPRSYPVSNSPFRAEITYFKGNELSREFHNFKMGNQNSQILIYIQTYISVVLSLKKISLIYCKN